MALKKSGVRVSLAPFVFFGLLFPSSCVMGQLSRPSQIPDAVLYAFPGSDGTVKISVAYRAAVASRMATGEIQALVRSLGLTPLQKPQIKTEAGADGSRATSTQVRLQGQLRGRDQLPDLLPFVAAFRGRKQIEVIIPASVSFGSLRNDQKADNRAYSVYWDRSQDGAYQFLITFHDPKAPLESPRFDLLPLASKARPEASSLPETRRSSSPLPFVLGLISLVAGIFVFSGVLLLIRRNHASP